MRLSRPRPTATTVGLVLAVTAAPAVATPPQPTGPDDAAAAEAAAPVLPPEWAPATATAEQEAAGAPVLTPADGTVVTGRQTVVASPTSETDGLASLTVAGEEVPALPNLGSGVAEFRTDVGDNSMSRGFSNYLLVNGTRIAITDTWANATAVVEVPEELLVLGTNTITVGAGPRGAACGMNYDDFHVSNFHLVLDDGTEVRNDANPEGSWVGDGNCGSNTSRSTTLDLTFDIDGERADDAGLLHLLDSTALEDGTHDITATTESGASTTQSIVVDNTGPALLSSVPAAGDHLVGDVVVAAEVADDAGVRTTPTLTLDGEPIAAGDTLSSDALAPGEHELVVTAEDRLGNVARHVVTFTSALNSPSIGAMVPEAGSRGLGTEVDLAVEVSDPNDSEVTATFYAADPAFPAAAYQGTARELPLGELDFTGEEEAGTEALRPGDDELLRSPSAETVTFQRFEIPVETDGEDDMVVSWSGEVDPARGVRLHVWDAEELVWEQLADVRGSADGETALSGPAAARHLDGDVVHVLVEGYDPFADDVSDEPDGAFRDPETVDFSLAHFTDTQFLAEGAAGAATEEERARWAQAYTAVPEWIVQNSEEHKIAFTFHTGDIIQNHVLVNDDPAWNDMVRAEFQFASEAQAILDDAGVPNGILPGNHDNMWGGSDELYNEYFGPERYEALSGAWENAEYGGPWREGDNSNHYDLFSAGGLDFVAVHLAYYVTPEEMAWANEILERYSDRNAIIATHAYLGQSTAPDGRGAGYSVDGQRLMDNVVSQNPNVFLVFGGHVHGVGTNVLTDVAEPGHHVVEMLADYQAYEVDGERLGGFMRLLQFDVDRSEMTVDTYSPSLDNHGATEFDPRERYDGSEDEFTVPVNLSSRTTSIATDAVSVAVLADTTIGTDTVASGETAAVEWTGLQAGQTHGWYVVAENTTEGRTVSPLATFTTAAGEPGAELGTEYHLNNGWDGTADAVLDFGRPGDEVFVGDWDGDGTDTLAVRRGRTIELTNSVTNPQVERTITYGRPGDVLVVGDFDGDGRDTFAVRRGKEYHVKNRIAGGDADTVIRYGRAEDAVLVGDWDGDGRDTFAVRRGKEYHVKNRIAGGDADTVFHYGRADDEVLVGDWDGDGRDTFGVRRGRDYHVRNALSGGDADIVLTYGRVGDHVLVGDWDGDGRDTLGIRR